MLSVALAAAAFAVAPSAWPQTSVTFKTGGPIPYATYLKRTGQKPPHPKPKAKASAPKMTKPPASSGALPVAAPQAVARPAQPAAFPTIPPRATVTPTQTQASPKAPAAASSSGPLPPPQRGSPSGLPEQANLPPTPSPAGARFAPTASLPPAELEAFVDGAVRQAMAADHVAGVAVVVVQEGQVLLQKGYGLSRLSPARPVDPQTTLFRLGSVSKALTWIEVLKQVDAGRLLLDAPIDDVLPERQRLGLEGFKSPVRLRDLMTHSAGFEARELGRLFKGDPRRLQGADAALRKARSRRVREAGRLTSYSNYGVVLAGAAASAAGKAPFDTLMEADLLRPAGLTSTTFREAYRADSDLAEPMTADLAGRLSDGFRWTTAGLASQPREFGQDFAPALSASATPHDMGRMMQMMLGAPAPWGPRVTAALFTPLPGPVAGVPGWTYALQQQPLAGGFAGFGQGGATLWFRSRLLLAPQLRLGVFVIANTDRGQALVDRLPGAVISRFYATPPSASALGRPTPAIDGARYSGFYLTTRRAYHGLEAMMNRLTRPERVSVGDDGRLTVTELGGVRQFVTDGPDRFVSPDGAQTIAFLPDPDHPQAPMRLLIDAGRGEGAVREGWLHEPLTLGVAALATVFTALLCLVGVGMRQVTDYRETRPQAAAAFVQTVTAAAWLFAIGATALFMRAAHDPSVAMYRWPNGWLVGASWAALAAALLTVVQIVQLRDVVAETRRRDSWSTGRRVRHILSVLVFVVFAVLVAMWGGMEPWSS